MNIDSWPIHWGLVFQVLVVSAVFLVLAQIKLSDTLDRARHHETGRVLFRLRSAVMLLKILALCWTVVYSYERNWAAWPPIAAFMLVFDIRVILDLVVMRQDINRLRQLAGLSGREVVGH